MRPILCAAVAAALTFGASALARSQTSSDPLTADDAVREALAANRDLQAARLAIDVARGGRLQAGRLENPELELGYADDFAFNAEGERVGSVGFAQSFPVTARLAREKDVASKGVQIAEAEVRDFERNLLADVQSAFYTVRALDEQLGVNRQLVASVREVENATARRLEAAEASPAEVSLLRIERLRLEQDEQRLIREREVAVAALARLLGRSASDQLRPVGELDPGRAPSSAMPTGASDAPGRPDLEAARRGVERADAHQALARSEIWQDWTVGLGYEHTRDVFEPPIGTKRDSFLSLDVTVPLPLWNRQQGRIASAEAERRRSRRSRDALVLHIEEEIRAAEAQVRTLRASVDAYALDILPEATRSQELFERGYRQGLVGIAELLQAQRQYNESRSLYFELLGDLRQAAIALETATGASSYLNESRSPGGTP
jgi:cobalt-zinc-cadmium efflux system outer membrane protein